MRILSLLSFVIIINATAFAQGKDFVELKDGTRYEGTIEVQELFLKKSRIIVNDTTTILMQDVEKYQSSDGYFVRMYGGYGDAFARRIQEGNIDLFIRQVPNNSPSYMPGPNGTMTYMGSTGGSSSAQYFSKDDGPILRANATNLKTALSDNPVSMQYLKDRDALTAVQVIGIIGGIVIGAASVTAQADKEEPNFTGAFVGLGVLAGSAWLPYFAKQDLTEKAIRAYNLD